MLIRDVMSRSPARCTPSDTVQTVAQLMVDNECGIIPVCDGAVLVGVITDRDIVSRVVARGRPAGTVSADDVMTRGVLTVSEDDKLNVALELMESRLVRRLPVVDLHGRLAGIVSEADLVARVPTLKVARAMRAIAQRSRKAALAGF